MKKAKRNSRTTEKKLTDKMFPALVAKAFAMDAARANARDAARDAAWAAAGDAAGAFAGDAAGAFAKAADDWAAANRAKDTDARHLCATMKRNADGRLAYDIEKLKRDAVDHPDTGRQYIYRLDHAEQNITRMEPDYARGKKQLQQVRDIAEHGGRATAHYSDADVTNAFTDYKKRNPNKGAWDAANALIRKAQPLAKWKGVTSPWNRIKRIAEGLGVSVEDWFAEL